jgi:hypothetical protein
MPVLAHHVIFKNGHLIFLALDDSLVRAIAPGHWALVVTKDEFERVQALGKEYALAT